METWYQGDSHPSSGKRIDMSCLRVYDNCTWISTYLNTPDLFLKCGPGSGFTVFAHVFFLDLDNLPEQSSSWLESPTTTLRIGQFGLLRPLVLLVGPVNLVALGVFFHGYSMDLATFQCYIMLLSCESWWETPSCWYTYESDIIQYSKIYYNMIFNIL